MRISRFFQEVLHAKVANDQWSWGAIDLASNRLFLRVWHDQIMKVGDREWVQVFWKQLHTKSHGLKERKEHLDRISHGLPAYGVVCVAKDPNTLQRRQIASFDQSVLIQLGSLSEDENYIYAELVSRVPVTDFMITPSSDARLASDIRSILTSKTLDSTTKQTLVEARVGQGAFRSAVLKIWGQKCCVTGAGTVEAVRASHIKPWRESTNAERLDPANGLPLTANLDALFDAGLITFREDGSLVASPHLPPEEQLLFGLSGRCLAKEPSTSTSAYLKHHREKIFRDANK